MEYRKLGNSDMSVSVLTIGSWLTYGLSVDQDRSAHCIDKAFDLGINFIDTANIYGRGAAEESLAKILASRNRDSYYIATKLFWPMTNSDSGLSATQIAKQCDESLRRLNLETIDVYYAHRYDVETPIEETMLAFTKLIEQGKVRYVGFSEWTETQIQGALAVAGSVKPIVSQPQYSMIYRVPEAQVFPLCMRENIGNAVWSPLAQGVLTGKYLPGAPIPADTRAADPSVSQFVRRFVENQALLEAVQNLRPIAADLKLSLAQLALAWVLNNDAVTTAIVGASRPEQLDDNVGAVGVKLTDESLARINEVLQTVVTA